ncbi:PepSY domain-containing protein [Rhodopseudomonas telluris]|uniref:PepSY domain-containing protein n=1 Tax=Rhodopseudomonas telluris TaxID=644215 RepID=A0ABV6ESZ1_9BRAD
MSLRSLLLPSVLVLCLIGQGMTDARAARETEAVDRAPGAGASEPELVVGSIPSGTDLVAMVERQLGGARVYDVALNDQGGAPFFEIKSIKDGNVWDTVVDVKTRQVISSMVVMPVAELQGDDKRNVEAFERSRMPLTEAIGIAEKYGAGRAVSAGLHFTDNRLVIVVDVVSNGALKEIQVEPDKRPARERSRDGRQRSPR